MLLLLACALSLGGWLVVGPTLAAPRAASASSVDIATPASRARRDAAIALARMPDRPLPLAASAAAASAGGNVGDDAARCGEDQVAVYKDPQPDPQDGMIHVEMPTPDPDGVVRRMPGEIKPPGVGYTGAMRRIEAALRNSGDPFDRAMADWLDLDEISPPEVRLDALVRDAQAASDPRAYALAYEACYGDFQSILAGRPATSPACVGLSAVDWARLDPGNAEPWLFALDRAVKAGDAAAQREAMQRMADSSRFDIHFFAGSAAVARLQMHRDADLAAQAMATMKAAAIAFPPYQALTVRCHDRADADLVADCARIAQMMFDHSDTFMARAIGGSVHRLLTGDTSWLDRAHREQRSTRPVQTAAVDNTPCGAQREFLEHVVRIDAIGEVKLAQEARRSASAP